MQEQELCEAVLKRAYETENQPGLLDVLGVFERVRREMGVRREAKEAVGTYRRLMRWGREGKEDWWKAFHADFTEKPSKMQSYTRKLTHITVPSKPLSDLLQSLISPTNPHSPIPSGFPTTRAFSRPDKDLTPTKGTSLHNFTFALPKFKPFLRRVKESGDADSISALYRVR